MSDQPFYMFSSPTPKVTVNVDNKASTVDAAKLLHEVEEKAKNKIVNSFTLNNNTFSIAIAEIADFASIDKKLQIIYKMNNQSCDCIVTISENEIFTKGYNTNKIIEEIVKQIAGSVVANGLLTDTKHGLSSILDRWSK